MLIRVCGGPSVLVTLCDPTEDEPLVIGPEYPGLGIILKKNLEEDSV
jgi:hypothetical protein